MKWLPGLANVASKLQNPAMCVSNFQQIADFRILTIRGMANREFGRFPDKSAELEQTAQNDGFGGVGMSLFSEFKK